MFAGASSLLGHLWVFAVASWHYAVLSVLVILDYDGAYLSVPVPRALCGDAENLLRATPTCMRQLRIGWLELMCYLVSVDAAITRPTCTCAGFGCIFLSQGPCICIG